MSEPIHKVAGDTHYLPPQSSPSHPILPSRAPWGAARVSTRVACGGQVSAPAGGWGEWQPPLLGTARMTPSWAQSRAGPEPVLARRIPSALPGLGRLAAPWQGPSAQCTGRDVAAAGHGLVRTPEILGTRTPPQTLTQTPTLGGPPRLRDTASLKAPGSLRPLGDGTFP